MIKLGITGGIGSGKSTVSEIFKILGIPVYIADIESKRLTNQSDVIKEKLKSLFGENLYPNGVLDKQMLASLIFTDTSNLKRVNAIIHPEVDKDFTLWVEKHSHCPIVCAEAAIMFESGMNKLMDKVATVYTPLNIRVMRTMKRDNTSKEKVLERINNQLSDEEKIKLSDYTVYNDEKSSIIIQVEELIKNISITNV